MTCFQTANKNEQIETKENLNIFDFRDQLIKSYESFSRSFTKILSKDIYKEVET